jgi:ADP-ribose pyrophosphatase YjhB (NUDIX family)
VLTARACLRPGPFRSVVLDATAIPSGDEAQSALAAYLEVAAPRWRAAALAAEAKSAEAMPVASMRAPAGSEGGPAPASIWLHARAEQGALIAAAARAGLVFHHAEGATATLVAWLPSEPTRIPRHATHRIGVGAVVVDAARRILVVREAREGAPPGPEKFPGGLADVGEDLSATARREVEEEVGLATEFVGFLAARHAHAVEPGVSDIYFLALLTPSGQAEAEAEAGGGAGAMPPPPPLPLTLDPREIAEARWVDGAAFVKGASHPLNRLAAEAALAEIDRCAAARGGDGAGESLLIVERDIFVPSTRKWAKA